MGHARSKAWSLSRQRVSPKNRRPIFMTLAPISFWAKGARISVEFIQAQQRKIGFQTPTAELKAIYDLSIAGKVIRLISIQDFAGYWTFSEYLPALLNICTSFFFLFNADPTNPDRRKVWITLYMVRWLELIAVEEEEVWELVVEKAGDWLEGEWRKVLKECRIELDWWEDSVRI